MSKHTPGPWTAETQSGNCASVSPINFAYWGTPISEETKANARLMAAAPEMLEALRRILKAEGVFEKGWECECDSITPCHLCQARAAIAKAEGSAE